MHGLQIGDVAARTGLAVSAIRFYEDKGLVHPMRTAGNKRLFARSDIRRLSFVMVAQELGFSLTHIRDALASLPDNRTPTKADWARISRQFRAHLDDRITKMTALRDKLDGCIGCGCLSMSVCALYNDEDHAGTAGSGPRFLMSGSASSEET